MSGGGDGDQTTTTEPPAFQKPFLEQLFKAAQSSFEGPDQQFFPGQTVAGFDPATLSAQGLLQGAIPGVQNLVNQAAQTSGGILQGDFLDPNKDPNLQATLDAAARPLQQTLSETILPNIRGGATATRGVGGSRQGIAEGLAAGRTQQAIGDTTANILNANRSDALRQITQTLALAPQTAGALSQPATLLDAIGQQNRNLEQAKIDAAVEKHNFEQTIEDQKINQFASIVSGNFGGTTTGPGPQGPSQFQTTLGLAATGASIGSFAGPWGTAIGAGVGALLGLFSGG